MADKFNLLDLFQSAMTMVANEQPKTDVAKIYAHAFARATQKIAEALNEPNALEAALREKANQLNRLADLVHEFMASEMPPKDDKEDGDDEKPEGEQKPPETEGTQAQPPTPPEPPKS